MSSRRGDAEQGWRSPFMYRTLSDERLLRLAMHLEETLETYEQYLRDLIPQVVVKAKLAPLFAQGPAHLDLRRAYDRVRQEAARQGSDVQTDDVLQILLECERIARDFYESQLDHLADPALVRIFQALIEEERHHAQVVQEAMAMLGDLRLPSDLGMA